MAANLEDDPHTDIKIIRVRKGRRYKYLKRPRGAGPTPGWIDWIHGKTQQFSNFERWILGRSYKDDPGRPRNIEDNLVIDCTQETSNRVRAQLVEDGDDYIFNEETRKWDKITASWVRSSREVLQDHLRKLIPVASFHWVKLDDEYAMLWDAHTFYAVHRLTNGICWCSVPFKDRADLLKRFRMKRNFAWDRQIDLAKWIRSGR